MAIKILNSISDNSGNIAEYTASSAKNSISVSGLHLPSTAPFNVVVSGNLTQLTSAPIRIVVNGDTTSGNYRNKLHSFVSTTTTSAAQSLTNEILTLTNGADDYPFSIHMLCVKAVVFFDFYTLVSSSRAIYSGLVDCLYSVNGIYDSIGLSCDAAGAFKAGASIRVFR